MIRFGPTDENAERFAEIERQLKKLDVETPMAQPSKNMRAGRSSPLGKSKPLPFDDRPSIK